MHKEDGKIEGNLTVTNELELTGMVTGSVEVAPNAKLHLNGMIIENLIVREGAVAFIRGTVSGDVVNKGGRIEVYGTINGRLLDEGGSSFIDPKAMILNKIS